MKRVSIIIFTSLSLFMFCSKKAVKKSENHFPAYPTFSESIVKVIADTSEGLGISGAGFIIDSSGVLLTAAHLIIDLITYREYANPRANVFVNGKLITFPTELIEIYWNDSLRFDIAMMRLVVPPKIISKFSSLILQKDRPPKGTQVIIAGFPTLTDGRPDRPVYRTGIIAHYWVSSFFKKAILDMPPAYGFSGAPVIALLEKGPRVIAIASRFTGATGSDFYETHLIPVEMTVSDLQSYKARWKTKDPK